ncbi:uncharacterized protein A4U43_C04F7340 [Asparagus officinalis]|uniref:DUF7138 domain-containing protein n=1 Tax=Asparagus officinalis TaxID=4686 RepID=A0A5P1F1N9_ASPOF|nr:uncharacterized protein LOC109838284 [Asparagus officinalis]ONK71327.1 uncharacterized protein A4U43_C04F7340 [Asparagus officinalis]
MTEQQPSAFFPVVFFDGDRDVDIGSIAVTASLDFRKFQSMIAQKIGASPHQISISLVRRKKARSSPEIQRKVPIDELTDFSAIALERDCFVLVVRRGSRSGRRGRGRRGRGGGAEKKMEAAIDVVPEMTILKRNHQEDRVPIGSLGFWDYEAQLRNLQRMRERYMMSAALYYPYSQSPPALLSEAEVTRCLRRRRRRPFFRQGGASRVFSAGDADAFSFGRRERTLVSRLAAGCLCERLCAEAKRAGKSAADFTGAFIDRSPSGFRHWLAHREAHQEEC